MRHLPSTETIKDQSLAVALMDGTWVRCASIYLIHKKKKASSKDTNNAKVYSQKGISNFLQRISCKMHWKIRWSNFRPRDSSSAIWQEFRFTPLIKGVSLLWTVWIGKSTLFICVTREPRRWKKELIRGTLYYFKFICKCWLSGHVYPLLAKLFIKGHQHRKSHSNLIP